MGNFFSVQARPLKLNLVIPRTAQNIVYTNSLHIFQQELLSDKDEDGNTPLMLAIESGSLDAAMLLVDRGLYFLKLLATILFNRFFTQHV